MQLILRGFGKWHWDVSFHPSDIEGLVKVLLDKI
jgi:hypothetical protein